MGSPKCVKFTQTQKETIRSLAQGIFFSVLKSGSRPRPADREAVFSLGFKVPEAMNSKENECVFQTDFALLHSAENVITPSITRMQPKSWLQELGDEMNRREQIRFWIAHRTSRVSRPNTSSVPSLERVAIKMCYILARS